MKESSRVLSIKIVDEDEVNVYMKMAREMPADYWEELKSL